MQPDISLIPRGSASELAAAAGEEKISTATVTRGLNYLNILRPGEKLIAYHEEEPWTRTGAESFGAVFRIEYVAGTNTKLRRVFVKAIVGLVSTDQIWEQWRGRINRLADCGVNTPRVYSYWKGLVFQEYIPRDFREYAAAAAGRRRQELVRDLRQLANNIDRAGFNTVSLVHNLRTDEEDLYLVDVGQDLGGWRSDNENRSAITLVNQWLAENNGPTVTQSGDRHEFKID